MEKKIKTIIIDDEKLARDIVRNYLRKYDRVELLAECSNGFEALKQISELKPDLIFLDIQMPKVTGFELLEILDEPPVIIFTTAFDQYALKAFEVNATDYLLKPFSEERFEEAMLKAFKLISNKDDADKKIENLVKHIEKKDEFIDRIVVKTGQKISIVPTEDIRYIEAQDDYTMLYTEKGNLLKQKTMKYFEENLDPNQFIRIHRSYFVKTNLIKHIELFEKESYRVILNDGTKLPVSKTGYQKLKEIMN